MFLVLVLACTPPAGDPDTAEGATPTPSLPGLEPSAFLADDAVRDRLAGGDTLDVVVLLDAEGPGRVETYAAVHDSVWQDLEGPDLYADLRFREFPVAVVELHTVAALERLLADPRVVTVESDRPHEMSLTESLPLIGQGSAAASGYIGAGTGVAVLDTGADYTRAAFGSCSAPGGSCKVAYAADFATADGSRDDNGHGTNVSAIVLGVAPGAKVLALDVFRSDGYAYSSDILSAIDWVISNQATYCIEAMNMSLGSGSYTSACTTDTFASAISNARSAGVLSAIASGNNGYTTSISSPACVPAAVSVGAVYDANVGGLSWSKCTDSTTSADKVTCFSNTAPMLKILAPGALITAADIVMGGTSQASPHVAGGIAVVRAAFPDETVDETVARLTSGGTSVRDTRTGVSFPRLNLPAALALTDVDATAPLGSVSINGGAAATNSTATTLTLAATDDAGVSQMCISNSTTCSAWTSYSPTKSWTTSSGTGTRTVYAWFKDPTGNVSPVASDTILGDTTAPANGTVSATPGNTSVALSWSGFSDAGAGLAGYKVVYGATAPSSCSSGTTLCTGTATTCTASALTNGTSYGFRVCATDGAGNTGTGATVTATPASEFTPPVGSVSINGGAAYTKTTGVTLTLSATDTSGVASMCVSNSATCSSWTSYGTTKSWTLGSTAGTQTVYASFRDGNGNVATTTDTIVYDKTAPGNGTVTATPGDGSVALRWAGFTDSGSSIAGYKVVYGTTAPASCSAGTTIYTGAESTTTRSGLANGTTYTFRVCAVDGAGNTGTGSTVSARPAPEFDPPAGGSVVVNGGATYTGSATVTVALSATDTSGVAQVCLSNSTSCTSWSSWAGSKSWTVSNTSGTRTVYAWFKDTYGNTTTSPASDSIVLDVTAPTSGSLSAAATSEGVTLSWSGATDAASGVASYKLVTRGSGTAYSCTNGTVLYTGTATSFVHAGVAPGTSYYRVCAVDAVGNVATGAAASVVVPSP